MKTGYITVWADGSNLYVEFTPEKRNNAERLDCSDQWAGVTGAVGVTGPSRPVERNFK